MNIVFLIQELLMTSYITIFIQLKNTFKICHNLIVELLPEKQLTRKFIYFNIFLFINLIYFTTFSLT